MKAKKKYGKGGKLYNKGGKMKKMSKIGQVSKSEAKAIERKAYMETDKALHERSDELKSKGRKGYSESQMAYSAYDAGKKAVKDAKAAAAKRLQVPNAQPKKSLKVKKAMNGMMIGVDPTQMKRPGYGLKSGLLGAALGGGAALLAKKLIDKKKAASSGKKMEKGGKVPNPKAIAKYRKVQGKGEAAAEAGKIKKAKRKFARSAKLYDKAHGK